MTHTTIGAAAAANVGALWLSATEMKLSPQAIEQRKAAQVALYLRTADNAAKRPVDESLRYLISGVPVYVNGWKRAKGG